MGVREEGTRQTWSAVWGSVQCAVWGRRWGPGQPALGRHLKPRSVYSLQLLRPCVTMLGLEMERGKARTQAPVRASPVTDESPEAW